jgi:hypothetical protein
MNRQGAKNAKKRKRERKEKRPRTTSFRAPVVVILFFSLLLSWRSWRLGGSF